MEQRSRNALGRWYDRSLGRILSSERLMAVLFCVLLNGIVYWGAQTFTADWTMTDLTTALDQKIPVVPAWAIIYVAAFPFWAVGYVLMARDRQWYTIMTAEVLGKLTCGVVFFLLPTTNVRPLLGEEPFAWLLELIYAQDAALCLLPSIHCLESWICFAGLRRRKDLPGVVRWGSFVMAVLVCISTLPTKQHVLVDVIAGVLLAEVLVDAARWRHWGGRLRRWFGTLDAAVFGTAGRE